MYHQNPLAFAKAQENVNTKVFFFFFLTRESMGSFGMRTDTKGGLDVASSYLFVGTNLYQRQTCHSPLTPDHQLNIFTGLMKFLFLTLDEIVFQVEGRPLQTNMC